ncbi:Cof-type HAD-IIB family hydrolase [Acetivibrio ethanolgignens]|uniref:Hydrolase n=1 Tax=Acetivibrio ethanolgignens TaxID=290052 RepID=A0A0V8QAM6_9FIRM|nr:Cof-type HAD-IIB family hydrolase [Acetivibrio ethanolgignens]KSV57618.1 hypothetical protein ASU35_04185 [Acetivibrio ethanolgignens]
MKRKIIFFDIDGTLLSEITGEIPVSAVEAIHKAQRKGHLAVINTGRTWPLLEKRVQEVGFDAYICGCGTKIVYRNEVLFHQTVADDVIGKVVKALEKYKIDGILEGDKKLYLNDREKIFSEEWKAFYDRFHKIAGSFQEAGISMDKLYTLTNPESDLEGFQEELGAWFDFIDRDNGYYELVPRGFSKASGIRMLTERLGMSMEDTISIGDSNNDLPMLTATAVSIAMGVHSEGIHDKVDFITKTVEEDGIYYALEHYGLF